MKTNLSLLALLAVLASLAVGCGSDDDIATTDSTPPGESAPPSNGDVSDDTVVFVWTETGGCAMAGPNCARYEVTADGGVTTYRENDDEPAASGSIDPAIVDAWLAALDSTDTSAMTDQLEPGELTAAFDGVDTTVAAPHRGVELSSVDYEFDPSLPFFQTADAVLGAAQAAAPLEVEMRE